MPLPFAKRAAPEVQSGELEQLGSSAWITCRRQDRVVSHSQKSGDNIRQSQDDLVDKAGSMQCRQARAASVHGQVCSRTRQELCRGDRVMQHLKGFDAHVSSSARASRAL